MSIQNFEQQRTSAADETFARIQAIRAERVHDPSQDTLDIELTEVARLERQARIEGRTEEFFRPDPERESVFHKLGTIARKTIGIS